MAGLAFRGHEALAQPQPGLRDRQLADLRDELRALQADGGFAGGRVAGTDPPPLGKPDRPA